MEPTNIKRDDSPRRKLNAGEKERKLPQNRWKGTREKATSSNGAKNIQITVQGKRSERRYPREKLE